MAETGKSVNSAAGRRSHQVTAVGTVKTFPPKVVLDAHFGHSAASLIYGVRGRRGRPGDVISAVQNRCADRDAGHRGPGAAGRAEGLRHPGDRGEPGRD